MAAPTGLEGRHRVNAYDTDRRRPHWERLPLRHLHGPLQARSRGPGDALQAHLSPRLHFALALDAELVSRLPARDADG